MFSYKKISSYNFKGIFLKKFSKIAAVITHELIN